MYRLLFLDADAGGIELARLAFARAGVEATIVAVDDRETFVRAADAQTFDAVLSDLDVPGLPGLAALEEARRRDPSIPFLFVSCSSAPDRIARCLEAGADDYVGKDQLVRLPSVVRRLVEARHLRRREGRLESDRRALARLVAAVRELSMARSMDQIAAIVRGAARELNGADGATFVLRDGDLCYYFDEDAVSPLWKGRRFPMATCISGWVMLHREPAVIEDIYRDPRIPADAYRPTFVKSLVMVPVRRDAPVAAIGNYWARPHAAAPEEVEAIQALADSTSVAIENVGVWSELEARVRARTAELDAANRELEAFSYSVSHDLRTPVSQVIGFARVARDDLAAARPVNPRHVDNVLAAAERIDQLIHALLQLSQASRGEPALGEVDLGALAREIADELTERFGGRAIEWRIGDHLLVRADPQLMRALLENLLSNAHKYSGKTGRAVIEVGRLEPSAEQTTFYVRDNGAGFDPRQTARLFTPFGRLHSAHEFAGTGVGLATCQRIVHRHKGRIWAESSPGAGATFWFSLPTPAPPPQ